jgi:hypothetical protein
MFKRAFSICMGASTLALLCVLFGVMNQQEANAPLQGHAVVRWNFQEAEEPPSPVEVEGEIKYGPDGDANLGNINHLSGPAILKSSSNFIPDLIIDTSQPSTNLVITDDLTISSDMVINDFKIPEGKTVTISGNVLITFFGDVFIPKGALLLIPPGSSLQLIGTGGVTVLGEIENQATVRDMLIATTVNTAETGKGIYIELSGQFQGAIAADDIRLEIDEENPGVIDFLFDKVLLTEHVEATRGRFKILALVRDLK